MSRGKLARNYDTACRQERMPENQLLPARVAADRTFSALPKGAMEPAAEVPNAAEPGVANDPQPVEDRLQVAGDGTAL